MRRCACRSSWNVRILKTDRSGMASVAFVVDLANAYEKVQLVAVWWCTFFFLRFPHGNLEDFLLFFQVHTLITVVLSWLSTCWCRF